MSLEQRIEEDLTQAMKAKAMEKVSVLRLVKAALMNYKIERKKEKLDDADMLGILQKQVKQRKESLESFEKAGRKDLADKEKNELVHLEPYLPKQISDEELKSLAQKAIAATGAKIKAEAGKVMKELMPAVKGRADGKRVNEVVISLLA